MVRAAVQTGRQQVEVLDLDLTGPGPGELLVGIAATGVCHSDLHVYEEEIRVRSVLGHEGAGTVEAVGEGVTDVAVGDHVVLAVVPQCGHCRYCTSGQATLCRELNQGREFGHFSLDGEPIRQGAGLGTFSEASVVHAASAVKIDPSVPFPQAALIGCGVMTGYGAAVNAGRVAPGDTVAVIGCGGVGLSGVQGARLAGASRIVAVDPFDAKLQRAARLGATDLVVADDDTVAAVLELTDGEGVDVALDFVGLADSTRQGLAMLRRGGRLVVTGLAEHEFAVNFRDIVINAKTVTGNFMGMGNFRETYTDLVRLYQEGRLDLDSMVSRTIDLTQLPEAFRAMKAGEVARSVIVF